LAHLRRYKQKEQLRIGIRDLLGEYPLQKVTYLWSKVADVAVRFIYKWLWEQMRAKGKFCIIAMGKWGGEELMYHSDLDLFFVAKEIDNETEIFNKLAFKIIWSLSSVSKEGSLFKVDLRLRPHGTKGEIVQAFEEFKGYLKKTARNWERQAFIKARVVLGGKDFKSELEDTINEFVYQEKIKDIPWPMRYGK